MPRYGAFTLLTSCSRCGQPLPINAPALSARCAACNASVAVVADVWGDLLVLFDDEHELLTEGTTRHHGTSIASMDARCSFARSFPSCDGCSTPLPLDIALDADLDLRCASCGRAARVYPVPGWLRDVCATAQQIYALDGGARPSPGHAAPADASGAAGPVAIVCPQCGGALHASADGARVVRCRFCSADVVLPARTVQEWFVRFDGETAAHRRARVAREANEHNARMKAAAKADRDE
ncbi:MAG: hypothetical protein ACRELB_18170 [Polyangiaceae bacterium]